MKNRSIPLNLITVVVLLFFTTTLIYSFGITDDFGIVRLKLKVLGFKTGNIVRQKNGSYKVDVTGFAQTSKAIILSKGKFIPFQVNIKILKTVCISKSDLKNYSINSKYLAPDIKIVSKLSRSIKLKETK
jgi:hypothetical protein